MYCLYRFLVIAVCVGNLVFVPVLLCAPSVIYVHTEPFILSSCSNQRKTVDVVTAWCNTGSMQIAPIKRQLGRRGYPYVKCTQNQIVQRSAFGAEPHSTREMADSFCFQQRRALFLFAVFNLVRILSFKFESMWLRSFKNCGVRQSLPGVYLNGALAVPFITRELCQPYVHGYGAYFIFMFTNGVCSLLLVAPYIGDFIALMKLTANGMKNGFYKTKTHLLVTLLALVCFLFTLTVNVLDMAFDPYCPTSIFGYPLLFPHLNFPLFLFALHHSVLRTHKEQERIIYEITDDDIYVYVKRYECLNSEDCSRCSSVYTMATRPSIAARSSAVAISGENIRRIESLRDLDNWLQEKMRMGIHPSEEKNIYY